MNKKVKVLLVEDDPNLGTLLKDYLQAKDYETTLAANGKLGFDNFKKEKFDICILDIMMPLKDGLTLAKEIRAINQDVPIIFLTAKSMKENAIEGFKAGADDYVTKPFSMEELLMRLQAILRRTKITEKIADQSEFKIGNYKFDYNRQVLELNGNSQKLTSKEADLLKLLCQHKNEVVDRAYALNTVWQNDTYFSGRSMDVYITKLRKCLKDDPKVEIINAHGKGFRLLVNN